MAIEIRELRDASGLTQKAFSELYGIPVSTLRKWEQGESSPPGYVIRLLARSLPQSRLSLRTLKSRDGTLYYYDPGRNSVLDARGNEILIRESLDGVKEQNLLLYLEDLFEDFYAIQEKFNRDCYYDKREDIVWSR